MQLPRLCICMASRIPATSQTHLSVAIANIPTTRTTNARSDGPGNARLCLKEGCGWMKNRSRCSLPFSSSFPFVFPSCSSPFLFHSDDGNVTFGPRRCHRAPWYTHDSKMHSTDTNIVRQIWLNTDGLGD